MRKLKIGDIFSFTTHPEVFIQFLGVHPLLGECIALLDHNARSGEYELNRILFYPVKFNCKQGNLSYIETLSPIVPVPERIRRAKIIKKGVVESWYIDDGPTTRETSCLSPEEASLPDGVICSHLLLLDWIEGGWNYAFGNYKSRSTSDLE